MSTIAQTAAAAPPAARLRLRSHLARLPWALLLLIAAGVALRLWLIGVSPLDPRYSNADDGDYFRRALRLAVTGQYLDDSWLIRPPGHIFFFAFWLRLALLLGVPQYGVLFVQLAQTALAALTVPLGYSCARRLFADRRAGLFFAAFLALWYPFIETATVLFTELIYLFLFLLHIWFLLRYDSSGRLRELIGAGLALGVAALTRSPALYALAFVVLWLLVREVARSRLKVESSALTAPENTVSTFNLQPSTSRQPSRFDLKSLILPVATIVISCLIVVGPWTARNYIVYQRFIPVDTLGQINLWLDLDRTEDRNRNIDTLRGMPQADRAPYALERARELIAADPLLPFREMWPTFRHIWKLQFVEDLLVKQSFFTRALREVTLIGLLSDLAWLVMMIAGLAALAAPVREGWHNRLFFLAWIGYSLATVLIFHVEPRYLLPLWTLFGLYAAGVFALYRRAAGGAPHRMARLAHAGRALLIIVFLALFITYRDYPAILARGIARETAIIAAERAYAAGDYPAAERAYRDALAAHPAFVDAQVGLALALAAQGRNDEARGALERDSSRRTELVAGALARDAGDAATAARVMARIEATAGENIQHWALVWLRPPPIAALRLGDGLDMGYIDGFSPAERDTAQSFRWLEGRGRIELPLAEPLQPGATLILRMAGGRPGETPLQVRIGGARTQIVPVIGGTWRAYRLAIPAELAGARRLVIELDAPTFVPALINPASDDARALSLMIAEVRLQ
jgi:hypothetical protein